MGKGKLTWRDREKLRSNEFVLNVTENRITYSRDFKNRFVTEYYAGKKPKKIFIDAGFDPKILGPKRIERAAARWRKQYQEGILGNKDHENQ